VRVTSRRALLLAVPVLVAGVGWGWWRGAERVRETRRELAQLETRRAALEAERRRLERDVEALRREREAKVRAAREALDVTAPGEVLVVVPQATPAPGGRRPEGEKRD